jgi:hypothetical protein
MLDCAVSAGSQLPVNEPDALRVLATAVSHWSANEVVSTVLILMLIVHSASPPTRVVPPVM